MVRFIPYLCYKRCLRQQKENRSIENSLKVNKGMLEMFSHIKQHMTSYDYCSMCKCTPGFSQCSIVLSGTYWRIQFFFLTVSGLMRTNFAINISKDKIHKISVSFVTKFTMKYEILLILLPKILRFKKRFIYFCRMFGPLFYALH